MPYLTPTAVDRGAYPDAATPWEQQQWRCEALEWVEAHLGDLGLRARQDGTRVRLRPWSVLIRTGVGGREAVWFKANPPGSAFEAALGRELARWVPQDVLAPLAVEARRGWSLLPDGGPLFCDALNRGPADPRAWEEPLRQYARMQRALVPHADAIERLGVPGARTAALPAVFDRLLTAAAPGPDDRRRLSALRPRLVEWCGELAALGPADTLDHADLHEAQVFHPAPGVFRFFDWGDAAVSHPFFSFLVPARSARERYGPEALPRLRDAYLDTWVGDGRTLAELRHALGLAWRLAALGRAASWGRVFPENGAGAAADHAARALMGLFDEPPLG